MVYLYPGYQQQMPVQQMPVQQFPQGTIPMRPPTSPSVREESYIENILRLNRGVTGTFYFSFDRAVTEAGTNVKRITGVVEQAGRDHVIIQETATGHSFLMPMIYFDFAEYQDGINYIPPGGQRRQ